MKPSLPVLKNILTCTGLSRGFAWYSRCPADVWSDFWSLANHPAKYQEKKTFHFTTIFSKVKSLLIYCNQDKWKKVMHTSADVFIPQATEIQIFLNVQWYPHLNESKPNKILACHIFDNQASFWDFSLHGVFYFYIVVYNIRC